VWKCQPCSHVRMPFGRKEKTLLFWSHFDLDFKFMIIG
jgi:hypothetical protein